MKKTLTTLTNILLHHQSSWKEKYDALQDMHTLFVQAGALNAYIPDKKEDDLWLQNGCAIAPKSAAMCLFEIIRTQQFVAGLKEAIHDKLQAIAKRPLHILDAGAGPYAIFSLLTACYFSEAEVQYTVLDIHPENIASIQKLIVYFGLQRYFKTIAVEDAITYTAPDDCKPDIIITETMKNGLNKETQMAISLNLNKQLPEDGIFIPEQIALNLKQIDRKKQKNELYYDGQADEPDYNYIIGKTVHYDAFETDLGTILTLNKYTREAEIKRQPICTIQIPDNYLTDSHGLSIYTQITVYKEFILNRNDTSITFPIVISKPANPLVYANQVIHFYYENGANPGLRFDIV